MSRQSCACIAAASVLSVLGGCASTAPAEPSLPPEAHDALIDRTQRTVENMADRSAKWFDGLFGSEDIEDEPESEPGVTHGRVSLATQWDERDGPKHRVKLKAELTLPALERRTRLLFGRGDADDVIDGSADENIDQLPQKFNDFNDEDWLLGLGYSRDRTLKKGWDFGVGLKLATPVEQLARASYRWSRVFGDSWLWRVRPQLYWKSDRGAGVSFTNIVDYALSSDWLFRSWTIAITDDETEGVEWDGKLTAYQRLRSGSAYSYSLFASGETDADVHVQDVGFELRYRRRIFREWLFLELLGNYRWPRETLLEERDGSFGVGVEVEMEFGRERVRRNP